MMKHNTRIEKLISSGKNVFSINDIAVIWEITDRRKLIEIIKHYIRNKRLFSAHKGIYTYDEKYDTYDLAQKLVPLSYISLYTALQNHGICFQHYSSIFCVAMKSRIYEINNQTYIYKQIKGSILFNSVGLINNGKYTIADKERTICDSIYFFPGIYFDNLRNIDTEKLKNISNIYSNLRVEKEVKKLMDIINNERKS